MKQNQTLGEVVLKLDRAVKWLDYAAGFCALNAAWHLSEERWGAALVTTAIIAPLVFVRRHNRKIRAQIVERQGKFMRFIAEHFNGCLTVGELKLMNLLEIWSITEKPTDYPEFFVARKWVIGQTPEATNEVLLGETLEEVRAKLPPGLHRMNRSPEDDPVLVESWL